MQLLYNNCIVYAICPIPTTFGDFLYTYLINCSYIVILTHSLTVTSDYKSELINLTFILCLLFRTESLSEISHFQVHSTNYFPFCFINNYYNYNATSNY